jgi:protein TonB
MTSKTVAAALVCTLALACREEAKDPPKQRTASTPAPSDPVPPPAPPPPGRLAEPRGGFEHPLYRYPTEEPTLRAVDEPPRVLASTKAKLSPEAKRLRVNGIVILELVVEPDGRASRGRVLKPLPFGLTQSAIDAIPQWKFRPARRGGANVRGLISVAVTFEE